ncbi:DUF4145 domain-containing protein [Streptomyces clavifer]|uniref:DUF4145 domain-containing protein n=1 Tax=Streptomyces clavifer TaxID=68188 RepID=UPI00369D55DC
MPPLLFGLGTQKKALFQALQELRDSRKIEGRLFELAQALRVLGNQGAHFSAEIGESGRRSGYVVTCRGSTELHLRLHSQVRGVSKA